MQPVLQVEKIYKQFRGYSSEWRRVLSWFGIADPGLSSHSVLKGVSFTVHPGESIGVLGVNGAGKSTLLKILSNTLTPDSGKVATFGRVASILELGMGFHPELTGRENVMQVGAMSGYTRSQLLAMMDDIEAFSELGQYFDKPVRQYSSGMQVRLAFSLATAHRPDLLIVDEALSVGDVYFQHKSFARIEAFLAQGTSLLLVSHDRAAIQQVCDRALLLAEGEICCDGSPAEVVDYYNAMLAERNPDLIEQELDDQGRIRTRSGTGEATVEVLQLLNNDGQAVESLQVGESVTLRAVVQINQPLERLVFGYMLRDKLGQTVFGTNTEHTEQALINLSPGRIEFEATFQAALGEGNYSISTCLSDADHHLDRNYEWQDLALVFDVVNTRHPVFNGLAWLPPKISVSMNASSVVATEEVNRAESDESHFR